MTLRQSKTSLPTGFFLFSLLMRLELSMGVLPWSRHFRCFPGQGDLRVAEFLAAVLRTGYVGPDLARNLQRRLSRRRPAPDGNRRHAIPIVCRGGSARHIDRGDGWKTNESGLNFLILLQRRFSKGSLSWNLPSRIPPNVPSQDGCEDWDFGGREDTGPRTSCSIGKAR